MNAIVCKCTMKFGANLINELPTKKGVRFSILHALRDGLKKELRIIYSFITHVATNVDTDIATGFYTREGTLLGYFYQGEYRLWEK